jgi:hypothetical protein
MWFPRWLVITLTPHHYKQMFNVSLNTHRGCVQILAHTVEQWLYYKNCQPGTPDETRQVLDQVMDIETWARGKQAGRDARGHA